MMQNQAAQKHIGILIGSLRKESLNKKLAQAFIKTAPNTLSFHIIDISSLPLYNEDLETPVFPESVIAFQKDLLKADLLLFITPEYNRSFSGVLKNALDWASRPLNPAAKSPLFGKKAAIAGVSTGSVGTAVAQSHLRSVLQVLGMQLIFQPEFYLKFSPLLFDEAFLPQEASLKALFSAFSDALSQ